MIDPYATLEDLQVWARARMQRDPDFVIGDPDNPYMRRWWIVPRNEFCNVYLHEILRSDDDRALHDHPWANTSLLIDGEYQEVVPFYAKIYKGPGQQPDMLTQMTRRAGDVITRRATDAHRLVIPDGGKPVISLFMTGPKIRDWGFWCPQGWRHWREFTGGAQGEIVGRGCE
jgi:hypothetical protein